MKTNNHYVIKENKSLILIFFLGIMAYSQSFHCSFHLDDTPSITDNFAIRNLYDLHAIWNFWPSRFITYLSLAFNYHFNGLDVVAYHFFNLLVHLLSAFFIWWLTLLTFSTPAMKTEKITRDADLIALLAGLVFVSHPVQTEAVTYIVQRAASMSTMFYLASLCFYVKSRLPENNNEPYYIGSVLAAIAAMFTKEIAITLPLMIVFYEFCFLKADKAFHWRKLIPFLIVLLIIPLTMLLTGSVNFQEMHRVTEKSAGITSMHYLLTQLRVMVTYIRLLFLPLNQNLDYDYPIYKSIFEYPVLLSVVFLGSILYFAQRLFLRYRLVSFSIFWFFLTLLPESSFIPIKDVIFEHRLYLPMVGYSIFLVSGAYYLLGKNNIKSMIAVIAVVVVFNSILTYQRNQVWSDEVTLWNDMISKSPHKARIWASRGSAYYQQGNLIQSLSDSNKAIDLDPKFADAYYNRGLVYYSQGNLSKALSDWNKTIKIDPDYEDVYSDRGLVYYHQGKLLYAIADYNRAIEINPNHAEAYINRAVAYYSLKEYGKAWADVSKAKGLGYAVNPKFIKKLKQASDKSYVISLRL